MIELFQLPEYGGRYGGCELYVIHGAVRVVGRVGGFRAKSGCTVSVLQQSSSHVNPSAPWMLHDKV